VDRARLRKTVPGTSAAQTEGQSFDRASRLFRMSILF
jgi:hypothetical protein